MGVPKKV